MREPGIRNAFIVASTTIALFVVPSSQALSWNSGLIQGFDSGRDGNHIETQIIRDAKGWKYVWKKGMGRHNGEEPPPVDFSREMVVGAFVGGAAGKGFSVKISSAEDFRDHSHLVVACWAERIGTSIIDKNVGTEPFAFLKIRRHPVLELINDQEPVTLIRTTSIHAEATVSSTKGPVRMTLSLYRKKIKAQTSDKANRNQTFWYRIAIKNVGKQGFGLSAGILWSPDRLDVTRGPFYLYPQIVDAHGKVIPQEPFAAEGADTHWEDGKTTLNPDAEERLVSLQAEWKRTGQDVLARSQEYIRGVSEATANANVNRGDDPYIWLEPGGSLATPTWTYWDDPSDALQGKPFPDPVMGYTRLMGFRLLPGNYRIRAVFDNSLSAKESAERARFGLKPTPDEVRFTTPEIAVQVVP